MIFNRILLFVASLIACLLAIKFIEFLEQFSLLIYISVVILWVIILSFTGTSFNRKKYAFRDHDLMYSYGVIFTSTVLIPYNRIQHLAIHQGFLSRIFDLASLQFYTAGGSYTDISIKGLSKEDAEKWKDFVSSKIEKLKR
jgi:membrane protein YdbS with pleckstrin-like domain